ncbi:hypothetical protein GCM10020331_005780 [Ectobacillus funiculus]
MNKTSNEKNRAVDPKKAQEELKVDIFGFGSTIERDEPEEWEKLERIWSKAFPDLSVQVHVEAKN